MHLAIQALSTKLSEFTGTSTETKETNISINKSNMVKYPGGGSAAGY